MMLYRNMKVKVLSLDGDTDFFDIVSRYISTVSVYNLSLLCTLNVDESILKKMVLH